MDIQLNFINRSNDANNSEVVIFQRNVAPGYDEIAVAWRVIQNCGQGENHPFVYPTTMQVSSEDSWGNFSPRLNAEYGQQFAVRMVSSGDQLMYNGPSASPTQIEVLNDLEQGAISANIFKGGKRLAIKTGLAPQQKAVFEFKPTIWIGVVSQVTEGQVMNSAILSTIDTEISLLGLASADIVMTGGGPGANSMPFRFTLQNVQMA